MTPPAIADLVPHAGRMCLLEEIVSWDAEHVCCRSARHQHSAHPLARSGRLRALAGVEYAAQATAVHGGLLARERGDGAPLVEPGRLVALKDCAWTAGGVIAGVDGGVLEVHAARQLSGPAGSIYDFSIGQGEHAIVTGRLTIKTNLRAG